MFKFVSAAMFSGLIGLGAMTVAPASAEALYLDGHGAGITVQFGDNSRIDHRRDHRRDYRRDDRRDSYRDRRPVRACTAGNALRKAEQMGVRRARVAFESSRVISVRGRDRRGPIQLMFGRSPSCPLIR